MLFKSSVVSDLQGCNLSNFSVSDGRVEEHNMLTMSILVHAA
jgi:hypothetical protein